MSTAAPRSCLKPPVRNPWVAEDEGESSTTSSGQHSHHQLHHPTTSLDHAVTVGGGGCAGGVGARHEVSSHPHHHSHDLLAHQYATPYLPSTSHPSGGISLPPSYSVSTSGCCAPPPHTVVSGARSAHSVAVGNQHSQPSHGVVHSHTAHSLHSASHSIPTAAHSVHSVPGTLQQPWVDPQLLWSTPALPNVGVGGGVFTVGGGGGGPVEGSCPQLPPGVYPQSQPVLHSLHSLHLGGGGSGGQGSGPQPVTGPSAGGGGWGPSSLPPSYSQSHAPNTNSSGGGGGNIVGRNLASSENWSRCERCHYYCFRAAQAAFVAGIVTGFSLLVAGGVFHRQHIGHLQVLVYIGAMISLVCVVLLVIFCAMNKDHRTRRGVSGRFAGTQNHGGDPEAVPLRSIEPNQPVIMSENAVSHGNRGDGGVMGSELIRQTNHSSCIVPPPNHSSCMAVVPPGATSHGACCVAPSSQSGCVIGPNNQPMCLVGPTNQISESLAGLPSVATSEVSHYGTSRHATQRMEEDRESSQRYNRLWKQPTKVTSEATSKL